MDKIHVRAGPFLITLIIRKVMFLLALSHYL